MACSPLHPFALAVHVIFHDLSLFLRHKLDVLVFVVLTGIEGLLRFGVAGAEGAVQLEVVHVVQEGAGDGPEHVLQRKRQPCESRNLSRNHLPQAEHNVHIHFCRNSLPKERGMS